MRLSHKTNLYFTLLALLVFAVGGIIFYYEIRHKTQEDADERLMFEKHMVDRYLPTHNALPLQSLSLGDSIAFKPIAGPPTATIATADTGKWQDRIIDTALYSLNEKESEPYRMLSFVSSDNSGHFYRVSIFKPLIETDDL